MTYLALQVGDDDIEGRVVAGTRRGLVLQELADLQLQIGIGSLQGAHLLQVGGKAVVEVLHGGLLVDHHVGVIATSSSSSSSHAKADAAAAAATIATATKATAAATEATAAATEATAVACPAASSIPTDGGNGDVTTPRASVHTCGLADARRPNTTAKRGPNSVTHCCCCCAREENLETRRETGALLMLLPHFLYYPQRLLEEAGGRSGAVAVRNAELLLLSHLPPCTHTCVEGRLARGGEESENALACYTD